jgi:hypothetical protein
VGHLRALLSHATEPFFSFMLHRPVMVHPVIHDFIVYKSIEEKFVALVNDEHQDIANTYGTIRRLSL